MTYAAAVSQLLELGHELGTSTRKFDLQHMRLLVEGLGHPERRLASVLIAGTTGKGAAAAPRPAALRASGSRTGLCSPPHMVRISERIRLDGDELSDAEFSEIFDRVQKFSTKLVTRGELPWPPSFFETLTAMAFEYF